MPAYDRHTADLDWCLHACPLPFADGNASWPARQWFDALPMPSNFSFTPPATHRLGILFESLLQSWIDQTAGFRLLAANLPVRDAHRTIGEFDLIVAVDELVEHWELAVKFYLCAGDSRDPSGYFGPNPVDTLAKKLDRLTSHQLKLSQHPAAQALLRERGWQVSAARGFVKGRLFYPLPDWQAGAIHPPAMVYPEHQTGWWCDMPTFHAAFKGARIATLPKPFWLAPVTSRDTLPVFTGHISGGTAHVAELDEAGNEISRGFIVSEQWLADTSS